MTEQRAFYVYYSLGNDPYNAVRWCSDRAADVARAIEKKILIEEVDVDQLGLALGYWSGESTIECVAVRGEAPGPGIVVGRLVNPTSGQDINDLIERL